MRSSSAEVVGRDWDRGGEEKRSLIIAEASSCVAACVGLLGAASSSALDGCAARLGVCDMKRWVVHSGAICLVVNEDGRRRSSPRDREAILQGRDIAALDGVIGDWSVYTVSMAVWASP